MEDEASGWTRPWGTCKGEGNIFLVNIDSYMTLLLFLMHVHIPGAWPAVHNRPKPSASRCRRVVLPTGLISETTFRRRTAGVHSHSMYLRVLLPQFMYWKSTVNGLYNKVLYVQIARASKEFQPVQYLRSLSSLLFYSFYLGCG